MKLNLVGIGRGLFRRGFLALILLAFVVAPFTGCVTMSEGGSETLYVSVDEKNARIYLNDVLLSPNSYAAIRLSKRGGPYRLTARKIGFHDKNATVTSRVNWRRTGVQFLDNLFGVVKMASFVVEASTGGLKQLDEHSVRLELTPLNQPPTPQSSTTDNRRDPVGDLQRWRSAGNPGYPPDWK